MRTVRSTWSALGVAVVVITGVVAPAALADPPAPQTEAGLLAHAKQRPADQAANPEHARRHALVVPALAQLGDEDPERDADVDPFLAGWAPAHGSELDVSLVNRYGVRMHGHLSAPAGVRRGLPAVLLLTGGDGPEQSYREMAHGLAEAGYVVLGLSVQGDKGSQRQPTDPDPSTPENESQYCHKPGAWQRPQEAGVRETGDCAGVPASRESTAEDAVAAYTGSSFDGIVADYEAVKARKFFGALDGVRWLLSAKNPWRGRIDGQRLGIAGHSLGAHAALLAANADPQRRFRAAVTFDGFGRLAPTGRPGVPTLFQHQDLSDLPHLATTDKLPGDQDAAAFAAAGVPTGVVHLAGSTHHEWSYVPPAILAAIGGASRDGKRVALHYAVAWFDLWLKPEAQADARRRLTAPTFSGSTDGSSRGEGPWDPATGRTVSPRLGGEATREHLSPLFRSWINAPGARCADLRAGC